MWVFSLVLYVTDIFEWERDNILICGGHILSGSYVSFIPCLICDRHILSGSYVSLSLVLYVTDIFEWERDNILICGGRIVNVVVGISDHLNLS